MLDSTLDRYVEFFMIGGMAFYLRHDAMALICAFFALLGSFMVSYSTALGEISGIGLPGGAMRRAERLLVLILGMAFATVAWPWVGSPLVAALGLLAVMGNVSAARRFMKVHGSLKNARGFS